MKKIFVLLLCICLLFTSCLFHRKLDIFGFIFKTDSYVCDKMLDNILCAINAKNSSALYSLFSKNALEECDHMLEQIEDLFLYCSGATVSFYEFNGAPMAENTFSDDGNNIKVLYPTYDVQTSDDNYRITFKLVATDTMNGDNEGVWSLYVIKSQNDADLDVAYRADDRYTTGIYIDVVNTLWMD